MLACLTETYTDSCWSFSRCLQGSFLPSEKSNAGLRKQQWGDKCGTGAHLHNFTHSHMASDAPQPHIAGLQKHHATLSENIQAETPFLYQSLRSVCGQKRGRQKSDLVSCIPERKSQLFEKLVCGSVCLGFRWLGLEVQENKRRSREACDMEDTAQSSLLPWLTNDIPRWRVRGQPAGWLTMTPVEHLLTPECEFTFS